MPRPARLSETEILDLIANLRCSRRNRIQGDDIAVFRGSRNVYAASDALIEGVHFKHGWLSPADIAYKLFARNWSDFLCKGIRPSAALLNLSLRTASARHEFVAAFLRRLDTLFHTHGLTLIGGDTARSPHDHFSLTFLGTAGKFIGRRSRSIKRGDLILQLGHVGGSTSVVNKLIKKLPCREKEMRFFRAPQIFTALPHSGHLKATIDQSDSVMKSLSLLAQNNDAGLTLEISKLQLSRPDLRRHKDFPANVLGAAEDLAVFAIADARLPLPRGSAAFRAVGFVDSIHQRKARVTYLLNGHPIKPPADGFEHFA